MISKSVEKWQNGQNSGFEHNISNYDCEAESTTNVEMFQNTQLNDEIDTRTLFWNLGNNSGKSFYTLVTRSMSTDSSVTIDDERKHLFQGSPKMPTPRVALQLQLERQRRRQMQDANRITKEFPVIDLGQSSPTTTTATPSSLAAPVSHFDNGYQNIDKKRTEQDRYTNIQVHRDGTHKTLKRKKEPILISVLYGMINVAIVLPVLMSFGTIIYKDAAFAPYLPVLVKLTVLSGAVHQLSFSVLSSLPFAIGQVQDAGLIFLSSMASTIVVHCRTRYDAEEYDVDEIILATATVILSLSTAILGVGVVLVAKARLASYIQMLPTPVVGGYLAFIGFFCGQAGLALMANVQVDGLVDWPKFVSSRETILHLLPGMLGGIVIYVLINRIGHMFVLPGCILSLLGVFYAVLALTGTSVQEAQQRGWVNPSDPPPAWNHTWDYLRFDKVAWSVFPKLIVTLVSMIAVVALSSSLDVMAIEIELGYPLDVNHELQTVGLSNVVSGLTGGYTGSYIFSQSIFSLRAGIRRRVNGLVVAICEVAVILLPFSPLNYVPTFFFGSLLVMIAVDLMTEWLWQSRHRTTEAEYAICLVTFGLIQFLGVEYGILAGLFVYIICAKLGCNVGTLDESNVAYYNQLNKRAKDEIQNLSANTLQSYGSLCRDPYDEEAAVQGTRHSRKHSYSF